MRTLHGPKQRCHGLARMKNDLKDSFGAPEKCLICIFLINRYRPDIYAFYVCTNIVASQALKLYDLKDPPGAANTGSPMPGYTGEFCNPSRPARIKSRGLLNELYHRKLFPSRMAYILSRTEAPKAASKNRSLVVRAYIRRRPQDAET